MIRQNKWNEAGKAGLLFGAISILYMYLTRILGADDGTPIINWILWLGKFLGCIWLMKMVMVRFVSVNKEATNSDTFQLGTIIALLSALIYAGISFADIAYFSAEYYKEMTDMMIPMLMEEFESILPQDQLDNMEEAFSMMPQYVFFSRLIYCFIYGTILSYIVSRYIPNSNPFADKQTEIQ